MAALTADEGNLLNEIRPDRLTSVYGYIVTHLAPPVIKI